MQDVIHDTSQYAHNRTEQSHEATRVRERGMRKFKSVKQAQRFLGAHAAVFNLGGHLIKAVAAEEPLHGKEEAREALAQLPAAGAP